ncbi:glutamate synthase subunit beta [Anaerolentibacter hominis]|uniref:glutamate synthase subunit beta n=1 Tax=Anaerolentibacter hominis TaxID=3079009 RepID=UPI0031B8B2EE
MGKPMGFMEYKRETAESVLPPARINHFQEFHVPLPEEKRKKQAARCMDCGVPFCQYGKMLAGMASGCPLNNLIPEWNDLLCQGNYTEALKRLLKTNNFPEFTARVCPALCEAACTCNVNGEPVCTKENEYSIIEYGFKNGLIQAEPPKVRTGKKVAVIGSGPAGLACADQLNKRGHLVSVYERSDRPGGLLLYGIPNMKLEKELVKRRISLMEEEGVVFITGADVGKTCDAEEIIKLHDCVVLACGASNPRDIKVPGRESRGIYFAVDYLKAVTKSLLDSGLKDSKYAQTKDKKVLVIGGGDTGNDCVGTAVRLGAASVVQLEMMPRLPEHRSEDNPWPEWPRVSKTDYGQEEAIAVFGQDPRIYQTTVKEFKADKEGNVRKAVLIKLESQTDKQSGRRIMSPVPGSEWEIETDLVLIAAGFLGAAPYVAEAFGVGLDTRSNVATEVNCHMTNKKHIFTAGDMHRGQSLVVWAIREGRDAAAEVDRVLMGYTNLK